jgi:hypothetical protein
MTGRLFTGLAIVAVAAIAVEATPAYADHERPRFFIPFFAPRQEPPKPRYYYNPAPGYYYNFEEPDPFREYEFDEGYYLPEAIQPRTKVKPQKKKEATATASVPAKEKKPTATASTVPEKAEKPAASSTEKGKLISCEKAGTIVSGYGFEAVKPSDCEGQLYEFTATRGGKSYTIKLSSLNGELTEVKKSN